MLSGLPIKHADMCDLEPSGQKDQSVHLKGRLLCDLLSLNPDRAQLSKTWKSAWEKWAKELKPSPLFKETSYKFKEMHWKLEPNLALHLTTIITLTFCTNCDGGDWLWPTGAENRRRVCRDTNVVENECGIWPFGGLVYRTLGKCHYTKSAC